MTLISGDDAIKKLFNSLFIFKRYTIFTGVPNIIVYLLSLVIYLSLKICQTFLTTT